MNLPSALNCPEQLVYLVPALDELAKLPAEDLGEDVETSTLESALRERVKGMKLREAITCLTEDSRVLKNWLKKAKIEDGWVFWISAYLMRPGPLARNLLFPRRLPSGHQGDLVEMELPAGWTSESILGHLIIRDSKVLCTIIPSNELQNEGKINQNEVRERTQNNSRNPLAHPGKWSRLPVRFGECSGYKYIFAQSEPVSWKALEYVLTVNGGFVYATINHKKGRDFDEGVIEAKFHTLRIISPI